ncbi:MAG: hypothetical protein KAY24_02220 [Candidatus Eisenbacteria sp.]|nr:hypothetical protein [Candidatus Eisenbacteria bacterium]
MLHMLVPPSLAFLGLLLAASLAEAECPTFPLDQVRPGLKGIALTVLEGSEPDSLPLEIIGIFKSASPQAHIILVRGGGEFTRTGVAQGMSGSPVFIDGKLLGALAFTFKGAQEPVGGVTPFCEMEDAIGAYFEPAREGSGRSTEQDRGGASRYDAQEMIRQDLPPFPEWRDLCSQGAMGTVLPVGRLAAECMPTGFSPIGLPVLIDCPVGTNLGVLEPILQAAGMSLISGGAVSVGSAVEDALQAGKTLAPGDAVGIDLITGDLNATAIGTVTWVDGNHVFAFGHPFIAGGRMDMPVSRAQIHAIVPLRSVSFKIGTSIEEVGALVADKRTGVGLVLGRRADRIALDVTLLGERVPSGGKQFHFDVARHELLTPSLLSSAVGAALTAEEFTYGLSTLSSQVSIGLDDGRTVCRRDLFRTVNPGQTIATEVMAPVNYLIASTFSTFPVCSVAVELRLFPELQASEIDRIQLPKTTVRPGEAFPVEIRMRQHRRGQDLRRVTLRVPEAARGEHLVVMVGSANAFYEWDSERAPDKYRPRSFNDLVRLVEEYPSDESLIVRLYAPSRGVVVRGRELSSLPLSKWHALSAGSSGGGKMPAGGVILDEVILKTGEVIVGGAYVRLKLEQ